MKLINALMAITILASSSLLAQSSVGTSQSFKQSSMGVGFGVPYGVIGTNLDINIAHNLNATLGMGTTILAGAGYNFGLKYFLNPPSHTFRPRISAYYGVNAVLTTQSVSGWGFTENQGESYTGLSLGFGTQWMWGSSKTNGLDLDVIFIATTGLDTEVLRSQGLDVADPGRIKISIGYRHAL